MSRISASVDNKRAILMGFAMVKCRGSQTKEGKFKHHAIRVDKRPPRNESQTVNDNVDRSVDLSDGDKPLESSPLVPATITMTHGHPMVSPHCSNFLDEVPH